MKKYTDSLNYLYDLQRFGIRMGLDTIERICTSLGSPQDRYPSVLIGGTNGKGSTATALTSILQEAGYRVGLYTSPHLVDFRERIRIQGEQISEDEVVQWTDVIRHAISPLNLEPTFFELTTAMALLHFARKEVDIAVLEVGMGGRLDATNIVHPWVTLITGVDYDHEEHLGRTLLEIAGEKCGIMKPRTPLITGEQRDEIFALMERTGESLSAPIHRYGRDFSCSLHAIDRNALTFRFQSPSRDYDLLTTPMTGRHQMNNLGLALAATEILRQRGLRISETSVRRGLAAARWEGRLEAIWEKPLILLDGAHNPGGVRTLVDFLREVIGSADRYPKSTLIFGVLQDKDAETMLRMLLPYFSHIVLTAPDTERARDPRLLQSLVTSDGKHLSVIPSVSAAVEWVSESAREDEAIVVCGSLYTVGEARHTLLRTKESLSGAGCRK
jgi:dihydrofolate synthase/folylpolyglutamate synthase